MGKRIRIVFSVCLLVMLGLFGWRIYQQAWTPVNWTMLAIAATACLLVFLRFVYIFNFSYALATVCNGALIWVARPSPSTALIGAAAVLYGVRLLWFTWSRTHSRSYASRMDDITAVDREMAFAGRIGLWFMCTWLLTFHLMAVWLAAVRAELTAAVVAGAAVMLAGTALEGLADWQKQRAKRRTPDRYVASGLFGRSRHPNYLGEILVQAGLVIVAVDSAMGAADLLTGVIAPLYIIMLMVSESRRVDDYQASRYGGDPDYIEYRRRSGSLLPKLAAGGHDG